MRDLAHYIRLRDKRILLLPSDTIGAQAWIWLIDLLALNNFSNLEVETELFSER
jgi:hypothetical protein